MIDDVMMRCDTNAHDDNACDDNVCDDNVCGMTMHDDVILAYERECMTQYLEDTTCPSRKCVVFRSSTQAALLRSQYVNQ